MSSFEPKRLVKRRIPFLISKCRQNCASAPTQSTLFPIPRGKALPLHLLAASHVCLNHKQAVIHYALSGKPYESYCVAVSQRDLVSRLLSDCGMAISHSRTVMVAIFRLSRPARQENSEKACLISTLVSLVVANPAFR